MRISSASNSLILQPAQAAPCVWASGSTGFIPFPMRKDNRKAASIIQPNHRLVNFWGNQSAPGIRGAVSAVRGGSTGRLPALFPSAFRFVLFEMLLHPFFQGVGVEVDHRDDLIFPLFPGYYLQGVNPHSENMR